MSIAVLAAVSAREFDAGGVSIGHAAGAQFPAGQGRSLAERVVALTDKVNEVITDGINALPLTGTKLAAATNLTIAGGVITVTQNSHTIDTEAAAASDDLDTVNGGTDGQVVFVRANNDARTVVLKHGTGNLICPYAKDVSLAEDDDLVMLVKKGTSYIVCPLKLTASTEGGLAAILALTTNGNGASLIGIEDAANLITGTTVEAALAEHQLRLGTNAIPDPGNAGTVVVTRSGQLLLTIGAGAETGSLPAPTFAGQRITIAVATIGAGTRALTATQSVNATGNTVLTFNAATDLIILEGVNIGGTLKWRVILNESVALS